MKFKITQTLAGIDQEIGVLLAHQPRLLGRFATLVAYQDFTEDNEGINHKLNCALENLSIGQEANLLIADEITLLSIHGQENMELTWNLEIN